MICSFHSLEIIYPSFPTRSWVPWNCHVKLSEAINPTDIQSCQATNPLRCRMIRLEGCAPQCTPGKEAEHDLHLDLEWRVFNFQPGEFNQCPLVKIQKNTWKITMFNGQSNYTLPFSRAMLIFWTYSANISNTIYGYFTWNAISLNWPVKVYDLPIRHASFL